MIRSILLMILLTAAAAHAQSRDAIYEERQVPSYTLPDPLMEASGEPVRDATAWFERRRPEILELFETHVYGRVPPTSPQLRFDLVDLDPDALDGRATRKLVQIVLGEGDTRHTIDLLVYLPNDVTVPAPLFVGLNFYGNHTITADPGVPVHEEWVPNSEEMGVSGNVATEASRGVRTGRWPVSRILERGYGLATMYYGQIDPDFDDGFRNGVHPLFYRDGQEAPDQDEWGSIGAWAWGLSRALDYFELDRDVDHTRVAVMGHSRLGKTSLWAGAADDRFAMVISNDSGCGGAALSRRRFGETVGRINTAFPHWFNDNFNAYNDNEDALPVDQHMVMALVAPRLLYVASAEEDLWADPRGEFLSAVGADPVYRLLTGEGLPVKEMPAVNEPVIGRIAYHVRTGKHDVTDYDWERWMDFADAHWK